MSRLTEVHAFGDIETLGLGTESPLLEASFTIFTLENEPDYQDLLDNSASFIFNVQEQFDDFRRMPSAATIKWWMTEPSEHARQTVMGRALDSKVPNAEVFEKIAGFLAGVTHLWTRGPHFDIALMNSLIKDCGARSPWKYYSIRDIRTLLAVLDKHNEAQELKKEMAASGEFVAHDSAHDVAIDAFLVQKYLRPVVLLQEDMANAKRRPRKG